MPAFTGLRPRKRRVLRQREPVDPVVHVLEPVSQTQEGTVPGNSVTVNVNLTHGQAYVQEDDASTDFAGYDDAIHALTDEVVRLKQQAAGSAEATIAIADHLEHLKAVVAQHPEMFDARLVAALDGIVVAKPAETP